MADMTIMMDTTDLTKRELQSLDFWLAHFPSKDWGPKLLRALAIIRAAGDKGIETPEFARRMKLTNPAQLGAISFEIRRRIRSGRIRGHNFSVTLTRVRYEGNRRQATSVWKLTPKRESR